MKRALRPKGGARNPRDRTRLQMGNPGLAPSRLTRPWRAYSVVTALAGSGVNAEAPGSATCLRGDCSIASIHDSKHP